MADYNQLGNFILFKETFADSIGRNFRVGELLDRKVKKHKILSDVKPLFYSDPKIWKILRTLLEGIKKSNINGLYSPEEIITISDKQLLIFPFMHFRNFESILEDSAKKGIPLNFDLAFSIAIAIADLLEIGSSIVISGQKSFHGFLTPDNILIDYEGKIYLKNYGIFPYISQNEDVYHEMEKHYGAWLTPEFFRKEKIVPQSDIYHLGYLLFKMLTGDYFSFTQGENFEEKISNISFSHNIPNSNKDFIDGLLEFFRKTLNPDPSKRFSSIREFKDYISSAFHIDELSSVTFNLAYFMDSLYGKVRDNESKIYEKELSYTVPIKKQKQPEKVDNELVESILSSLDTKQKQGRPKLLYILLPILIIGAIAIGLFLSQSNRAKKIEKQRQAQAQLLKQQNERIASLQDKIKKSEKKATLTAEEKIKQDEDKQKLLDQLDQAKKEKEKLKKIQDAAEKKKEEEINKKAEEEKKRLAKEAEINKKEAEKKKKEEEIARKKLAEEAKKPKPDQLIPINEVDTKPVKVSGKATVFPPSIRSRYHGNKFFARAMCLIDYQGNVKSVKIVSQIPKDIKSAISKSLLKWKFQPAVKKGVRVKVWHQIGINISI